MPNLPAEITFATEATLRSSSTKLHGSIPTIPTVVLPPLLMLRALRYMSKRPLPRPGEPHGTVSTVSTVSELHCSADIQRVAKHDMLLNVMLQSTQICKQQILRGHKIANFEHYCPEVLVVFGNQCQLAQVKQFGLLPQCMVQVPKLSLQLLAKVLPSTNPQLSPTFGSN